MVEKRTFVDLYSPSGQGTHLIHWADSKRKTKTHKKGNGLAQNRKANALLNHTDTFNYMGTLSEKKT